MIARKDKEMGIPLALAVSIAYHESRLNPDAPRGADGEYGIMQVMPKTGKGMGFTNQDLADPDKNIEAGLKYLKQNLDAFNGDQKMATVGYNAGTNSSFFSGGELPKITEAYVLAMKGYGAYDTDTAITQPAEANGDMVAVKKSPEPPAPPDTSGADRAAKFLFGGAGAAAGTAVAGAGVGLDALENRAVRVAGKTEAAKIAEQTKAANIAAQRAVPTVPGAAAVPTMQTLGPTSALQATDNQATRILQGTTGDEGTTGKARMGFNEDTSQQSAQQKEMNRKIAQLRQAGVVADDAPALFAKSPGMTSTPSGVRYPRSEPPSYLGPRNYDPPSIQAQAAQSGALPIKENAPYKIGANRPPIPAPTPIPKPTYNLYSVIDDFKSMMRPITSAVGTVSKYVLPPLGGLSAGLDVADIAHEYDKPEDQRDYTKMGLKAASGLGGALSMLPGAARVGIPLSLGATGIQYLRENPDFMKNKMQGISKIPLLDEMTGPLP